MARKTKHTVSDGDRFGALTVLECIQYRDSRFRQYIEHCQKVVAHLLTDD